MRYLISDTTKSTKITEYHPRETNHHKGDGLSSTVRTPTGVPQKQATR